MEISQARKLFFFFFFKYTPSYALFFIPLSISQFSFVTQHKATEMYLFSCSYLKYLCRQHRHSCTCCQWLPGLYCAVTASQNICMLTPWPLCKTKVPTGNAINSFWGQKMPLATGVTARADRSVCSQRGCACSAVMVQPDSQCWVGKEEEMQVLNIRT